MSAGKYLLVSLLMILLVVQPAGACPELMPVEPVTEEQYPVFAALLQSLAVYESF